MKRNATFDESGKYRYTLERTWDGQRERVLFIMLNPSDADEEKDDATIRKCIGFAKCWGYGGLMAGNLFAWVSTDPKGLIEQLDPVGPENDAHLQRLAEEYGTVVVAWGNRAKRFRLFQERQKSVKELLRGKMQCLGENDDGTPKHPGRLAYTLRLRPYGD